MDFLPLIIKNDFLVTNSLSLIPRGEFKMNKNLMALAILAAISGPLLSGCGGSDTDSDSDSSGTGEPTPPNVLMSPFIDGVVTALPYQCLDTKSKPTNSGVTDTQGNFSYNKGETCSFSINDSTLLGTVTLNTRADYISPYHLASGSRAARIASLLQTLDTDANHDNGITLNGSDLAKLPAIDLSSDEAFEQSMAEALATPGLSQTYSVVDTTTAQENMDKAIAEQEQALSAQEGDYYSQKVDEVAQRIADEEGNNWNATDFEQELADYKRLLGEEDSSNGKDKEMMLALVTLMEVTNDPIVAKRITPENKAGYTDMLPQVLEMILQGSTFSWNESQQITTDMAELMGKYAVKAAEAADMIERSFNTPTRIAVYGTHDEFVMNYDQAMAIRASAMALASNLNIAAAYDYGNDENYLPKQFDGKIAALEERCHSDTNGTQCSVNKADYDVSAEYSPLTLSPNKIAIQETVLTLRPEAPTYLALAKEQLAVSAQLGKNLECNVYEYEMESDGNSTITKREPSTNPEQDCTFYFNEEVRNSIDELSQHLRDPKSQPDVTLYPRTNDDGSYNRNNYAKMDLNVFFDTGVDRHSFIISERPISCSYEVNHVLKTATSNTLDVGLSVAADESSCSLTESETQEIINSNSLSALPYLGSRYEEGGYVKMYAQAGQLIDEAEYYGKPDSTFDKMMIECVNDGEEQDCMKLGLD